jgi:flagellar basal-body rod protein FlgG
MVAQMHRMDVLANNLANVDLTGYKRDTAVHKAFPEMLIRRMNDDHVYKFPFGSVDVAPVVGRLGTGVETNEVYTVFEQGAMQETGNDFDLALDGEGFFSVMTPQGERYTRNGSFVLGKEGLLLTKQGYPVLGENGPIRLKKNNFVVDKQGRIFQNAALAGNPDRLVSMQENEWEAVDQVDTLRIVDFKRVRYLEKQGASLWRTSDESGEAASIPEPERPAVHQGFLEAANVNPVTSMVEMIEVNRAYEANQRLIRTEDNLLGRLINETTKV